MSIFSEIDAKLFDEVNKLASAPRDTQMLVVMNTEARNEFMRESSSIRTADQQRKGIMAMQYRGAILAVTDDEDMPRVSIFTKAK